MIKWGQEKSATVTTSYLHLVMKSGHWQHLHAANHLLAHEERKPLYKVINTLCGYRLYIHRCCWGKLTLRKMQNRFPSNTKRQEFLFWCCSGGRVAVQFQQHLHCVMAQAPFSIMMKTLQQANIAHKFTRMSERGKGRRRSREASTITQSASTTLFLPHRGGSCSGWLFSGEFDGFSLSGGSRNSWA